VREDTARMAETREARVPVDSAAKVPVQAMWREQNAAFRARVLGQLRQARDDAQSQPRTA
jgi:isocitrate dehydrogenase